ncbi:hypothetical protein TrVFT333_006182 [Trichoderma virens FT-333]|nr:hypothetical protein TrVFT333_006182 [Trichoderma virens FT-333]
MPGENEEGLTSLLSGDEAREDEGAPPPSVGDNPSRGNETHERSDRYAKVEILKNYIPELDPKPERSAKRSTMLTIHMMVALLVVLVNCTILFVVLKFYPPNTRFVGTFMFDNCKLISAINSALHMGLNMISTFFLGAGNFCMQILVAPSRKEIDKAHSKGISLEIGVPSIKNLPHIRRRRRVLWGLLGLMSSLLHLFWNSVIFTSIPITAIPRAIATNDFLVVRDNWTTSDPLGHFSWWKAAPGYGDAALNKSLIYSLETSAPTFTRLNTKDCIARSIDPLNATSSFIVVARNISS